MANELKAAELPHRLTLDGRSRLSVTGVLEVESFDERAVALVTARGALTISRSTAARCAWTGRSTRSSMSPMRPRAAFLPGCSADGAGAGAAGRAARRGGAHRRGAGAFLRCAARAAQAAFPGAVASGRAVRPCVRVCARPADAAAGARRVPAVFPAGAHHGRGGVFSAAQPLCPARAGGRFGRAGAGFARFDRAFAVGAEKN